MLSSLPLQVLLLGAIATANPLLPLAGTNSVQERDVCATYDYTEKISDGAPKQIWLWKQLTTPLQCTKNECEVASSEDTSYEIGFSTNVKVPAFDWIDAGFSVARTITTGQSNTCTANKGQKVCVFEKVAHTEYSVRKCERNICWAKPKCEASFRLASPNKGKKGGSYTCGYDSECKDQGYSFWEGKGGGGGGCKRMTLEGRRIIC